MTINIIDHEAAHRHLGDALEAIKRARAILNDVYASSEVRGGVIDADDKVYLARTIINEALFKQKMESTP